MTTQAGTLVMPMARALALSEAQAVTLPVAVVRFLGIHPQQAGMEAGSNCS